MELRKKALLIGLVLGDGCIVKQTKYYPKSTRHYYNFEVIHTEPQKEYLEWKAEICRKLTGKKCVVKFKESAKKKKMKNGHIINGKSSYRFTCCDKYFRVLYHWLYPGGKKKIGSKYLKYLTPEAIAIWYMDDGSTYKDKVRPNVFTCEIYTHTPLDETNYIINYFKETWDIEFHLHKKTEDQYCIRCYTVNAAKFIYLISPFVPQCMDYKVNVSKYYFQEIPESWISKIKMCSELYGDI